MQHHQNLFIRIALTGQVLFPLVDFYLMPPPWKKEGWGGFKIPLYPPLAKGEASFSFLKTSKMFGNALDLIHHYFAPDLSGKFPASSMIAGFRERCIWT